MVVLRRLPEGKAMTPPYYRDEQITLYHGDARDIAPTLLQDMKPALTVIDPPWDDGELVHWSAYGIDYYGDPDVLVPWPAAASGSVLVFTDSRRLGEAVELFGPPQWCFTWDTMSPWQTGPRRPLQQTKQCLFYGELDGYRRDGVLWGDAPEERDHPSTKQTPLDGRRLTDLWRESLRWLHHPGAGSGSAGTERFSERQGAGVLRHAKPTGWLRCLIGNCAPEDGVVFDPFAGSGSSLRAAKDLGRIAVGIEIDEAACEYIVSVLAQETIFGPVA